MDRLRIPFVTLVVALLLMPRIVSAQDGPDAGSYPTAQPAATQEIALSPGWNYVSLTVRPPKLEVESILKPVLDKVVLVEDEEGRTFNVADGIADFTEWKLSEAYKIFASDAASFSVHGKALDLDQMSVDMEIGWNLVPMYLEEGLSVDEAFEELGDGLVMVKSSDGLVYYPEEEIDDLTTVTPGEGYFVYSKTKKSDMKLRGRGNSGKPPAPTDDSETPTPEPPPADADHSVASMADALALRGLQPGEIVHVQGYYEPGDGGGGTFEVTESGCAPDGATCYVPEEHQAEALPSRIANNFSGPLAYQNVVFGSVRLYYNETEYLTDLQLHGHRMHRKGEMVRMLDHGSGRLSLSGGITRLPVDRGNGSFSLQYSYATTNSRLERAGVSSREIYVRWLGAGPVGSDTFDASDHIAWAINLARERAVASGEVADVVFDDMYYYTGFLQHKHGVRLRGSVAGVRDGQGMKVLPGTASIYFRERLDPTHELYLERPARSYYQDELTIWIRPQSEAGRVIVQDLELDGNVEGNMDVFENKHNLGESTNSSYSNQVDHRLQNTQFWNGYASGPNASRDLHILLENVHFHDYGGNIINTQGEPYFDGSNRIKVGNSARNHAFYDVRTRGEWIDNIEVYGYAWGAPFITYHGNYRNLTISELVYEGPAGYKMDYPINVRGTDSTHPFGPGEPVINIEDFSIDADGLSAVPASILFQGHHIALKRGRIATQLRSTVALFEHRTGLNGGGDIVVEDVDFTIRGSKGFALLKEGAKLNSAVFRNININMVDQRETATTIAMIIPNASATQKQIARFENITTNMRSLHIVELDGAESTAGFDIYVSGTFNNESDPIRYADRSAGVMRVLWYECQFNASGLTDSQRAISYFRDCTDSSSGTLSSDWKPEVNTWPSDVSL